MITMTPTLIATHEVDRWGTLVRTEYRVRGPALDERSTLAAYPAGMPYADTAFLLERRTSKRDTATADDFAPCRDWEILGGGATPEDAASSCGESAFLQARAEHALYHVARAREIKKLRREGWLRMVRDLAHGDHVVSLKCRAQIDYERTLKASRLYKRAKAGNAPQAKIDAIQAAMKALWLPQIERAVKIRECAKAKLNAIGEANHVSFSL